MTRSKVFKHEKKINVYFLTEIPYYSLLSFAFHVRLYAYCGKT